MGARTAAIPLEMERLRLKNPAMQDRDYQALLLSQDGHIVTLTFNKPEKKNPLSQELVNELLWALDDAEEDPEVRVVVLTGAGNAFSAGADLKGMTADRGKLEKKGEFDDLLLRFDNLKKPVVARIPGYVMGGAMGIVACCNEHAGSLPGDPAVLAHLDRGNPGSIYRVTRRVLARAAERDESPVRAAELVENIDLEGLKLEKPRLFQQGGAYDAAAPQGQAPLGRGVPQA